ncbi:hypothetical protein [Nocardia concava]|uniref:hypothetical protein n=1 Tax=Nocardia concava TaxID=257281 RepID=UPI0003163861|nr:hypothetical protein [Nocardia concava]
MTSDDIYVDSERTRSLITTMNTSADALNTVRADGQVQTVAGVLPGTKVEAACVTGSQNATTAIGATTEKVRTLAVRTDSGLKDLETQDRINGTHITQAGSR